MTSSSTAHPGIVSLPGSRSVFAALPDPLDTRSPTGELLGTIDGDWSVEKRLHRQFHRARISHPRVPELFAYSIIGGAIEALIAAQPEWEDLTAIPWPTRTFNNAAMDALVVEMTMKRLLRGRQ